MIGPKTSLILQQLTLKSDGMGGFTETFASIRHIKGALKSVRGNESLSGDTRTLISTHKFYCNFQKGIEITEKDILIGKNKKFHINFIDNVGGLDKKLEIWMEEIK